MLINEYKINFLFLLPLIKLGEIKYPGKNENDPLNKRQASKLSWQACDFFLRAIYLPVFY